MIDRVCHLVDGIRIPQPASFVIGRNNDKDLGGKYVDLMAEQPYASNTGCTLGALLQCATQITLAAARRCQRHWSTGGEQAAVIDDLISVAWTDHLGMRTINVNDDAPVLRDHPDQLVHRKALRRGGYIAGHSRPSVIELGESEGQRDALVPDDR
ncbi:hypothetical protein DEJ03_00860 [Curtobacterium sp. MCLR17_043]|nr:hypothetical protein DEJ03_00860 [Curtobacterium sp. MCLR17_043]